MVLISGTKKPTRTDYQTPVDVTGKRTLKQWPNGGCIDDGYKMIGLKATERQTTRVVYTTGLWQSTDFDSIKAAAHPDSESKPPPEPLDRTGWTATAGSLETAQYNGVAGNVLDGDPNTIWHTLFGTNSPQPHTLDIDMQARCELISIKITPKQDNANGRVADLEVYVSEDGIDWGAAVHTATLPNNTADQSLTFARPAPADQGPQQPWLQWGD